MQDVQGRNLVLRIKISRFSTVVSRLLNISLQSLSLAFIRAKPLTLSLSLISSIQDPSTFFDYTHPTDRMQARKALLTLGAATLAAAQNTTVASSVADLIDAIPTCGVGCLTEAASSYGCDATD